MSPFFDVDVDQSMSSEPDVDVDHSMYSEPDVNVDHSMHSEPDVELYRVLSPEPDAVVRCMDGVLLKVRKDLVSPRLLPMPPSGTMDGLDLYELHNWEMNSDVYRLLVGSCHDRECTLNGTAVLTDVSLLFDFQGAAYLLNVEPAFNLVKKGLEFHLRTANDHLVIIELYFRCVVAHWRAGLMISLPYARDVLGSAFHLSVPSTWYLAGASAADIRWLREDQLDYLQAVEEGLQDWREAEPQDAASVHWVQDRERSWNRGFDFAEKLEFPMGWLPRPGLAHLLDRNADASWFDRAFLYTQDRLLKNPSRSTLDQLEHELLKWAWWCIGDDDDMLDDVNADIYEFCEILHGILETARNMVSSSSVADRRKLLIRYLHPEGATHRSTARPSCEALRFSSCRSSAPRSLTWQKTTVTKGLYVGAYACRRCLSYLLTSHVGRNTVVKAPQA